MDKIVNYQEYWIPKEGNEVSEEDKNLPIQFEEWTPQMLARVKLTKVIAVHYVQTPRRQSEKRGTLVLAEFETEKGNERYRCWSSSLKHIDSGELALDELKDFWKHDMQVIPKQAIGAAAVGSTVGFAALAALKIAGYDLPWP